MPEKVRDVDGKISFWSFVCAVLVVFIHCSWTAETEIGRLAIVLFKETLARMAVPFFFACSGYFLARHFVESGWWVREVRKRIVSLGVPYLVWTMVYAGVLLVMMHEVIGIGGLGLNLCMMPALAPLWYVRCLMLFVFLAPAFKSALDRAGAWALVSSYALLLAFGAAFGYFGLTDASGVGGLLCYGLSAEGLFYFIAGLWIRCRRISSVPRRSAFGLIVLGCALIVARLAFFHARIGTVVDLRILIAPVFIAGLWAFVRPVRLPGFLLGSGFPIFVMHGVVIVVLRTVGGTYAPCNPWLELAAGVAVPVVFVNVVRRYVPRTARILFGGRT